MKTRKKKIEEYEDRYEDYFQYKDSPDKLIEKYFKDNGLNLEKAIDEASRVAEKILRDRTYSVLKLTFYENPFKTERPRVGRFKNIYSPNAKNNHNYLKDKYDSMRKTMKILKPIATPAEITINAYLPVPKVKKKHAYEILLFISGILKVCRDPDYDNIAKAYTDMLNETFIYDDKIFYKGVINKYYAILPKVEVIIEYQNMHDSAVIYETLANTKIIQEYIKNDLIDFEFLI